MKTIKLIILICIAYTPLTLAQLNSSMDVIIGLELSNRSSINSVLTSSSQNESPKFNYRIGINGNKKITNNIWIKTGLRFASVGYKGPKQTELRWPSEHDGNGGFVPDPNLPRELQFFYDQWYIEMPMITRYEFEKDKKITPFIEFGVSPHLYLTSKTKQVTDKGTEVEFARHKSSQFNNISLVGLVSFGFNYKLNEKYVLLAQPVFRYHISRLTKSDSSPRLYNFGIELGIRKMMK